MFMTNAVMKISLPMELKKEAEALATEGHYSTTSGYVQQLIRREVERKKELHHLEKVIEKSLASGISDKDPKAFLSELKEMVRSKIPS
jgi:antitoxin ParD1/3/4